MKVHAKYPYDACEYVGSIELPWNSKKATRKESCFANFVLPEFEKRLLKASLSITRY